MEALPPEAVRYNLDTWEGSLGSCFRNYLNVNHRCLWGFFISPERSSELKFHNKYHHQHNPKPIYNIMWFHLVMHTPESSVAAQCRSCTSPGHIKCGWCTTEQPAGPSCQLLWSCWALPYIKLGRPIQMCSTVFLEIWAGWQTSCCLVPLCYIATESVFLNWLICLHSVFYIWE